MINAKVSIICPLYNKISYIEDTLLSVVNQTYDHWELLIIDDGSTDKGDEIALEWAARDTRILFFRRMDIVPERKGGSVCRNIGIQKATGTYTLFLDADDVLQSDCLLTRIAYANTKPSANLIIFNHNYFLTEIASNFKDKSAELFASFFAKIARNKKHFCQKQFLSYNLLWTISNPLWKTSLLQSLGGFDESFQRLQDPELHTKALLSDDLILDYHYFESEPDVHIRIDENRHAGSEITDIAKKYEIFFASIKCYLIKFSKTLEAPQYLHLSRFLKGYIYSYETNIIRSRNQLQDLSNEQFRNNINILFDIIGSRHNNFHYKSAVFIYRFFFKIPFFRKLKLHSITYKLFYYL